MVIQSKVDRETVCVVDHLPMSYKLVSVSHLYGSPAIKSIITVVNDINSSSRFHGQCNLSVFYV